MASSVAEEAATQCIHKAYELGINFFDTANVYTGVQPRRWLVAPCVISHAIPLYWQQRSIFPWEKGQTIAGYRENILWNSAMPACDGSELTTSICTSVIATIPKSPWKRYYSRALDDLVTQGKVLYVGVSEWSATQIDDAVHIARETQPGPHRIQPACLQHA